MLPGLNEIKLKRKQFGLSQQELAAKAGVSQSLVSKIEAGTLVPSFENAKKIFDCLNALKKEKELKAVDVMRKHVFSTKPSASVSLAIKEMAKHAISQMPVIENENVLGTFSEKSALEKIHSWNGKQKDLNKETVSEVMEEAMPIVQETTPVNAIAELLEYAPAILIAKKGKITGIIAKSDLLKASIKREK